MLPSTTHEIARLHAEDLTRDARQRQRDARLGLHRRRRPWSAPVACRTCPDSMTA